MRQRIWHMADGEWQRRLTRDVVPSCHKPYAICDMPGVGLC